MDINFTNQLAVSLSQSIIIVIAAAVIGAIVAGGFGVYRDYKKEKILGKQKKLQAYGQLVGVKNMLLHSCILYFNAQMQAVGASCRSEIDTYFHRLNGVDEFSIEEWRSGSTNFIIACEERNKVTMMGLELAKADERFWRTISQIQIFFSHMPQVPDRISLIHQAQRPIETYNLHSYTFVAKLQDEVIALPRTIVDGDEERGFIGVPPKIVQEWSIDKQAEIDEILTSDTRNLQALHEALESKIDGLLDYIKPEVEKSYRITPNPGNNGSIRCVPET